MWRQNLDRYALPHFLHALRNNLFAGFQTVFDNPKRSCTLPNRYGPDIDFIVLIDDSYLILALQFTHCFLRHEQRVRPYVADKANPSILSGTENVVRIGKHTRQSNSSCLHIDLPVCK